VAAATLLLALAACGERAGSRLPGAPGAVRATAGNASASIVFTAPALLGQSDTSSFVATCKAPGESLSGRTGGSPVLVSGMTNGLRYNCTVSASNSAGTGQPSSAVEVTPRASQTNSLASAYRSAKWASAMSVTFPSECSMTVWSGARPNHAVDAFYLAPPLPGSAGAKGKVVARTAVSGMPLVITDYRGDGAQTPISFNICPSLAATSTATNAGTIGILISGASLYKAAEIVGHRASALKDNVSYRFRNRPGESETAHFIDKCNGHPTPANAGNSYHYHGLSPCVTAQVDEQGGPSHLIGVALDGFPIYGDRDIDGKPVALSRLDTCNGITSATPEFPQGIYHYVLPANTKEHNSSMRCYAGSVPWKELASAQASGFCYSAASVGSSAAVMSAIKM
jgi:hypothetical protein